MRAANFSVTRAPSMHFVDEVKLAVKAGDGGNGSAAFRRARFEPLGGPSGGDGGRGGDIIFVACPQLRTLLDLRYRRRIEAPSGEHGRSKDQYGKAGADQEIRVPIGTAGRLKPDKQERVSLWIHTSVREDALDLYGFARRDDRRLFRRLTSVNRIGPSIGLATLSELTPTEIVGAVRREDVSTFTRVSGIGKKTAQRLILELQNKLDDLIVELPDDSGNAAPGQHDELRSALINLGFQPSVIDSVVSEFGDDADDQPMEALLRQALQMLN